VAKKVKTAWFGKHVSVLLVNDKSVGGVLTEVTDDYIVLEQKGTETQVMLHAVVALQLAANEDAQSALHGPSVPP
jgi:ferredoxin-fold anticodon binding domain-containing protein